MPCLHLTLYALNGGCGVWYTFPWFLNILKQSISPVKSGCHTSVYKNPKEASLWGSAWGKDVNGWESTTGVQSVPAVCVNLDCLQPLGDFTFLNYNQGIGPSHGLCLSTAFHDPTQPSVCVWECAFSGERWCIASIRLAKGSETPNRLIISILIFEVSCSFWKVIKP